MNVNIDVKIAGDNGGVESYRVVLNQDELTEIVRTKGIDAGNKALEGFVNRFSTQFREKLGSVVNR